MRYAALFWLTLAAAGQDLPRVIVTSATHPGWQNDFEQDAVPLAPRPVGDEPATVAFRRAPGEGRGMVLRLVNEVSGGFFGVDLHRAKPADLPYTRLAFDYRADPRLKVNLFARVRHQDYEIGFCGPPADSGREIFLGRLPEVVADGQWRRLEVPLLALLRREVRGSRVQLTDLLIENRCAADYLLAGFGGNAAGTTLELDNFLLERPGGSEAKLLLTLADGRRADGWAVVVDQLGAAEAREAAGLEAERQRLASELMTALARGQASAVTERLGRLEARLRALHDTVAVPETITQTAPEVTLSGLSPGVHLISVRARLQDRWTAVTRHRLVVDTAPPRLVRTEPADGAAACPDVWSAWLADDGVGLAPDSLTVTVAGQALTPADPAVAIEPLEGRVDVDLARLGLRPKPGETIALKLEAADENGRAMAPASATFKFDPARDTSPPQRPRLVLRLPGAKDVEPLPGEGTFESSLDEWQAFQPGQTILETTDSTAAGGQRSLRLRCTENASAFACFVRRTPFDAARYRRLSFDYKIPDRLRVDFWLYWQDRYWWIRFTDREEINESYLGEIPNIIADNQWHHAEFDLFEMLKRKQPAATDFTINRLMLHGGALDGSKRFEGNYAGTEYFIDNFAFIPTLGADARLEWRADDLTGVTGAEVAAAPTPDGLPTATGPAGQLVRGDGLALETIPQGLNWVWLRLLDGAGNRSRPLTFRLLIDAGRPQVGAVWPADGSRAAPRTIGLALRDDEGAGLDLGSIRLEVAGVEYAVDQRALRYDEPRGQLIWDGLALPRPVVFTDQQTVEVALKEVRDQAGNRPKELPRWRFTFAFAEDRRGPDVEVQSRTHYRDYFERFEGGLRDWAVEPAGAARLLVDDDRRGHGQALWLETAGRPYAVWYQAPRPYAASRYGLLSFDYNIPPGAQVDLLLQVRTLEQTPVVRRIGLTDGPGDPPRLGQLPGIVADGRWRRAIVPVDELLGERKQEFKPPFIVDRFGFGDAGAPGPAARIGLDNVMIFRPGSSKSVRLQWEATDETGVAGYSWVLDDRPDTLPPAEVKGADTSLVVEPGLPAEVSYFHIRAVDGAGNWGPPTHFVLVGRN